ncbi:DUF2851 family protein [Penaeicola halotolerans]|uniref:DUF2851 family protein n=1 Tax=Penaeicola halotolerans TaxID=2793196 RepID=UPI001CF88FF1|nr:DUF2851 family protein [Penaeicola halotolerans]
MKEDFLHHIWKTQLFNTQSLQTIAGESLEIRKTGSHNLHEGPDFLEASVLLDGIVWHGPVEIHIKSSDWLAHKHESDARYDSVILHVVWEADVKIFRKDGSEIPTLALLGKIPLHLIRNYEKLSLSKTAIPCAHQLSSVKDIVLRSMLEEALVARLYAKGNEFLTLLEQCHGDWEEASFRWLARCFGFKSNAAAWERLAEKLSFKIIRKHSTNLLQLEALIFGMSGLLQEDIDDPYASLLRREFSLLTHKYQLSSPLHASEWKFMRIRPASFPTLRMAQFAALCHHFPHLYSTFVDFESADLLLKQLAKLEVSKYWQEHYHFGKPLKRRAKYMGKKSLENILLNMTPTLLAARAKSHDETSYFESAFGLLELIKAERNYITELWEALSVSCKTAYDSQSMIALYNQYCQAHKCLQCKVGASLISAG